MTTQGRSLDDLPLAAYTTGTKPNARLEDDEPPAPAAAMASADAGPFGMPAPTDDLIALEPGAAGKPAPRRIAVPPWLANPRTHVRDPRLLLSGLIALGLVLLVLSLALGGGGASGPGVAGASPSAPTGAASTPPPAGDASVEITGKLAATYPLTGMTGSGPAVAARVDATWADATGTLLGLRGAASAGTRTTDSTFVLTWSVLVEGAPVLFTSQAGECTVGMAVQPKSVTGSFTCKKLKSADGKYMVDARGTYRT